MDRLESLSIFSYKTEGSIFLSIKLFHRLSLLSLKLKEQIQKERSATSSLANKENGKVATKTQFNI